MRSQPEIAGRHATLCSDRFPLGPAESKRRLMRTNLVVFAAACGLSSLAACGDDTGAGGAGGSGASGPGSTSSQATGASQSSTQTGSAQGGGGGGQGGAGDCDGLPVGPITPTLATDQLSGSEDFAFDGNGNVVGKSGGQIVAVDANDTVTPIATLSGQAYGLRYGLGGNLYVARPNLGTVVRVDTSGNVSDFITGLSGPNGVYPDFDGNVWITEIGGDRVLRVDSGGTPTVIAEGAEAQVANGIVKDDARNVVFFTNYSDGIVLRVDTAGATAPVEVGQVPGALFDGIVLDACGNLYAVDNGNDRLYRFDLDPAGSLMGQPVLLVESFDSNVANAQFGSGAGWDATTLYVAGNPGEVWAVPVGVEGAPVPTIND